LPNGNFVYVTNSYSNNISVIRTSDFAMVATISCGGGPYGVAALPNSNYVYVTKYLSDSVSVIGY